MPGRRSKRTPIRQADEGPHRREVINHLGDQVMKVFRV